MSKTIIVAGFGPGISKAVAEKFGREGFSVALVGRSEDKLAAGVKGLAEQGIKAAAFPTDLGDPAAVRALVGKVHASLGPVSVLHWNAYPSVAGDLLTADDAAIRNVFDLTVTGLVAAIQESLPDLRKDKESAVLVTNGGLGYFDPQVDAMAVQWNTMGLAVGNAAKHKLVRVLGHKLKSEGIYLGEVVVLSLVKGTAFDSGTATLEASAVADRFWQLFKERKEVTTQIG
ncbi:MAG: Short-chain dehydrogenase/reductase [Labilithrix sp.]|nr:Short-chain dehydrogenase/reductase [Labilithrix sp.]